MMLDGPYEVQHCHAEVSRELASVESAVMAGLAAAEERLNQQVTDMRNEVIRFQAERESRFATYVDDLIGIVDLFRNELVALRREI